MPNEYCFSRIVCRLNSRERIETLLGLPSFEFKRKGRTYTYPGRSFSYKGVVGGIEVQIKYRSSGTKLAAKTPEDLARAYDYVMCAELPCNE